MMDGMEQRLDGNAAAGLLEDLFSFDVTTALSTCAGCGQTWPMGALYLYGGEMGSVLRCPSCDAVHLRLAAIRGRYLLDLRGITAMQIPRPV